MRTTGRPSGATRRTRLPRCGEIKDGDRRSHVRPGCARPRRRRSRPHRRCRCPRRRADSAGAAAAARPRSRGPIADAHRHGDGRSRAAGATRATLFGKGAMRPTLIGTATPSALATSDRRRSRSEVMARNSTVPQPSATPPMSPDASPSAKLRLRDPARRLGGRAPGWTPPRRCCAAWHPPSTAATFRSGPGWRPAGRSASLSLLALAAVGAAESCSICVDSVRRRPAVCRCAPAGRPRAHSTATRVARPGTRGRPTVSASRRRTASASSGAVRVSDQQLRSRPAPSSSC